MKTLKEHVTESLAFGTVKDLHARMTAHAKEYLPGVLPALQDGIRNTSRIMRSKFEGGSLHDAAVDHLSDHLHDNFQDHPKYTPELARTVAKQVVRGPKNGPRGYADDRKEFSVIRKKHYAGERNRMKRMVQDQQDSEDKKRIQLTSTDALISNRETHIDLHKRAKERGDAEWASELSKKIKWHNDELSSRGVTPPKPVKPKSTVYDYTKRGLVARKLPPFRKA